MSKGGKKACCAPVKLDAIQKPEFWQTRLALFDRLYAEQQEEYKSLAMPIKVTLPDGKVMDGESWVTTPLMIAKKLSNSLADKVIIARVDEQTLWDLQRPLEADCKIELLDWDYPEAREVFWHSSAHVLGYAMERVYGCKLSTGPPLKDGGFFYEGDTGRPVEASDYPTIEAAMTELVKAKEPYQRLVLKKEHMMEMFGYNDFKQRTLGKKVPEGAMCTVYRCGTMIDPCRGPHLPDTGRCKAFAVTKNSSSYFQGNADNEVLQRVYAISFPKNDQLKEWKVIQEEAAKRDHRVVGKKQELFYFHDVSPGSAFFMPHGTRIYNAMMDFQRKNYRKRGFDEVISPNIYNKKLWEVSGHWALYKDAMFQTCCEHEDFGLKPMNCPGHCVMFAARPRSYRELPIRFADFGVLHRNELSGALSGLTRVRRFQQDDAHIFCRMDQLEQETDRALDFLKFVYDVLGFKFYLKLSTRPANALGDIARWDEAEYRLKQSLNKFCGLDGEINDVATGRTFSFEGTIECHKKMKRLMDKSKKDPTVLPEPGWEPRFPPWEINEGDGAFYGPKIDVVVEDAFKRRHQCATVQLDFNLPERFGLKYTLPQAKAVEEKVSLTPGVTPPVTPSASPVSPSGKVADTSAPAAVYEQERHAEKQDKPLRRGTMLLAESEAAKKEAAAASAAAGGEDKKPKEQHMDPSDKKHILPASVPEKKELQMHIDRSLEPNQERPVMLHRAIFGSVERCMAILCEHYCGKWPFWLSPRQAIVIPVSQQFQEYAEEVKNELYGEGFWADVDASANTLEKKVREAQLAQYNFILVVGKDEVEAKSVNIRTRDNQRRGSKTVEELLAWFHELARTYSREL